jgi:hypothetical protein
MSHYIKLARMAPEKAALWLALPFRSEVSGGLNRRCAWCLQPLANGRPVHPECEPDYQRLVPLPDGNKEAASELVARIKRRRSAPGCAFG